MMSHINCKQSIRIEKSGWFKHYFPGNLRRNILFQVCNYTSYQNLQKTTGAGSRVPGGAQAPPELFLAPPEPFEPPLTIEKIMH